MSFYAAIDRTTARPQHLLRQDRAPFYAGAILLAAALLLRCGQFGNPIAGLDEQLYLLVGDRMWHSELPYRDLWDRKPVGLFLLFAAIRALPGNGVVAAQVVATICAAATALVIALIAQRRTAWRAATMAGIFYLAALNELWGDTTQTPVFYNLPIAIAVLLVLRATQRGAMAAMLLCGVAIQIKTNAVFEGALLGCWIVAREVQRGKSLVDVARFAVLLILGGALPTLVAMGWYWRLGAFDCWWQANVASVLAKGVTNDSAARAALVESAILASPALLLAGLGLWATTARFQRWRGDPLLLASWVVVALADFFALGGYFPHYALPLMLACAVLAASAFALRRGVVFFMLAMVWPFWHAIAIAPAMAAAERGYAVRAVASIPAAVRTRCLFIFQGPVAYYSLTDACRVTRFAFTAHLSSLRESRAMAVDPIAELDRAMMRRPVAVVTIEHSTWPDRNPATEHRLAAWLRRYYVLTARLPHRAFTDREKLLVWQLR